MGRVFSFPPQWIPDPPLWRNYIDAFSQEARYYHWTRWLANSVLIAVGTIIGNILSNSIVAFGFARLQFPGRDFLFLVLMSTMMLPFAVTIIPLFLMFSKIGWIDTFKPLIAPSFFGNAFYIFLIRQFYLTIPLEMDEAARIDGASSLQIWMRVILPLSRPVLAAVAIFTFIHSWNDFLWPLIVINAATKWTLQLGLLSFRQDQMATNWHHMMVISTLMALPCLTIFFAAQRYFIQGITVTGIKG